MRRCSLWFSELESSTDWLTEAFRKYFFLWCPMLGERDVNVTGLHFLTLFGKLVVSESSLKLALFEMVEMDVTEAFDFFLMFSLQFVLESAGSDLTQTVLASSQPRGPQCYLMSSVELNSVQSRHSDSLSS